MLTEMLIKTNKWQALTITTSHSLNYNYKSLHLCINDKATILLPFFFEHSLACEMVPEMCYEYTELNLIQSIGKFTGCSAIEEMLFDDLLAVRVDIFTRLEF